MTGAAAAASNQDLAIGMPQGNGKQLGGVTPSTPELRRRMGVNSPRLKTKDERQPPAKQDQQEQYYEEDDYDDEYYDEDGGYDGEAGATTHGYHQQQSGYAQQSGGSSGLDALVTQVARPDPNARPMAVPPPPQSHPSHKKGPRPPSRPKPKQPKPVDSTTDSSQQSPPHVHQSQSPSQQPAAKKQRLSGLARLCSCFMPKRSSSKAMKDVDMDGSSGGGGAQHTPEAELAQPMDDNSSSRRSSESSIDDPYGESLLGPRAPENRHKKTLVLDLDETLVHSSFKPVPNPDFIVPITIDNNVHQVYVMKRPGVDEFMQKVCQKYEVVLFTASLSKYANPLLDILDPAKTLDLRLFREACVMHCGTYVKDLSLLGRKLRSTIIVDNSPQSYSFHPSNAVPISSWFDDRNDRQLYDLLPLLNYLADVYDVRESLDANKPIDWLLHEFRQKQKEQEEQEFDMRTHHVNSRPHAQSDANQS